MPQYHGPVLPALASKSCIEPNFRSSSFTGMYSEKLGGKNLNNGSMHESSCDCKNSLLFQLSGYGKISLRAIQKHMFLELYLITPPTRLQRAPTFHVL